MRRAAAAYGTDACELALQLLADVILHYTYTSLLDPAQQVNHAEFLLPPVPEICVVLS